MLPYIWHIWTRSLSVVFWLRPRMYRFVRLSCSPAAPVVDADDAGGGGAVLRLVERVPPAEPVLEDDEDAVLAGDAAVGTRAPVTQPPPIDAPVYWCGV